MAIGKKPKFTFKKEPRETGLRSVGNPYQSVNVKLGGKVVGQIDAPNWNTTSGWRVSIVADGGNGNPNCPWHWDHVGTFDNEQQARAWLQDNATELAKRIYLPGIFND